jgi:hypothetical protein
VDAFEESLPDSNSYHLSSDFMLKYRSEQAKYILFMRDGKYPNDPIALNYTETDISISVLESALGIIKIISEVNSCNQQFFADLFLVFVVASMWSSVRAFYDWMETFLRKNDGYNGHRYEGLLRKNSISVTVETALTTGRQSVAESESAHFIQKSTSQGLSPVVSFISGEVDEKELMFKHVSEKYVEIRELIQLFNETVGPIVFLYVLKSVMHYTTTLDSVFTSRGWLKKISVVYVLLGFIGILWLSADISVKVELTFSSSSPFCYRLLSAFSF